MKKFITHHIVLFIVIVGALFALVSEVASVKNRFAAGGSSDTDMAERVSLADIASFRNESELVPVAGVVESADQVDIRSLVASPVESVNVRIGDSVSRGQEIVALKNADIAAALAQAKAGYSAALARLAEIRAGARPEDIAISKLDAEKAVSDMAVVYASAATSLTDAAGKMESILRTQISDMFANGDSEEPRLTFTVTNASDAELRAKVGRLKAGVSLKDFFASIEVFRNEPDISSANSAFSRGDAVLADIRSMLDALMVALQNAPQLSASITSSYKASVTAGRATATVAATSILSQRQSIAAQAAMIERTKNLLAIKQQGATQEQILAAQSAVDQAAAAVAAASAAYDKTVIKAPISGKISSVSLRVGDLATLGGPVASIVNTRALKVKAFVSAEDLSSLRIGNIVSFATGTVGTVGMISPGIDPSSKKAEITILIPDADASGVVVGQYIEGKIRTLSEGVVKDSYLLPLEAVKIADGGAYVYTVEDGRVKEIPVQVGQVEGEYVRVSGASEGSMIIPSIRQLRPGDKVEME